MTTDWRDNNSADLGKNGECLGCGAWPDASCRDHMERERALRAEMDRLAEVVKNRDDYIGPLADRVREAEAEVAALRADLAHRERMYELCDENEKKAIDQNAGLRRELAKARALLACVTERLAEWDETGDWTDPKVTEARAFLRGGEGEK